MSNVSLWEFTPPRSSHIPDFTIAAASATDIVFADAHVAGLLIICVFPAPIVGVAAVVHVDALSQSTLAGTSQVGPMRLGTGVVSVASAVVLTFPPGADLTRVVARSPGW